LGAAAVAGAPLRVITKNQPRGRTAAGAAPQTRAGAGVQQKSRIFAVLGRGLFLLALAALAWGVADLIWTAALSHN